MTSPSVKWLQIEAKRRENPIPKTWGKEKKQNKVKENHQTDKMTLRQTDKRSVKTEVDQGKRGDSIFCPGTTASICPSVRSPTCPATSHTVVSHLSRAFMASSSAASKALMPSGPFRSLSAPCGGRGNMNIKYASWVPRVFLTV